MKTKIVKWVITVDINWPMCATYFCILFWLHNTEENPKPHNKQLQMAMAFFWWPNLQLKLQINTLGQRDFIL